MKVLPFQDMRQRALRKIAIDAAGIDLDGDLEIAVDRMKMGRPMISVLHGDDNTEESTEFRHSSL